MFRAFDVWKRFEDGTLVRYRCFETIPHGGFCVQSADFYASPLDEGLIRTLESQFLELLFEEAPDQRAGTYPTIEEAIAKHDEAFNDAE